MADMARTSNEPDEDEVGRGEIALTLGVSEREITNLVKAHVDFPSVVRSKARTFPRRRCVQWYVRFKALEAVKRAKPATPNNLEELRRRREEADMKMAEMDVAEREGRLVGVDQVDRVVGELCDRLRAALVNLPGNHGIRLEELGVDAARAEGVLTVIAEDLTRSLRASADEIEALSLDGEAVVGAIGPALASADGDNQEGPSGDAGAAADDFATSD